MPVLPGTTSLHSAGIKSNLLKVGASIVHVGDLTDDAFPILLPYKAGTPDTSNDPDHPGSLAVRHHYLRAKRTP